MAAGPLQGIRVLEFTQIVAAPFCGCILSDQGADVVKVEGPKGDPHRNAGAVIPGLGKRWQSLNRGKRSLVVDLQSPEGRDLIYQIIPDYDVVLINFRVGVAERLGIDYESLKQLNEKLIYCEITGFGSEGPLKNRAGTDVVGVAYTGLMVGEAKVDENGLPIGVTSSSIADYCAGFSAASSINAALFHREKTGKGQKIETSLLRAGLAIQDTNVMREPVHDAVTRDGMMDEISTLRDNRASYPEILAARAKGRGMRAHFRSYYGGYQTEDGRFLVLGALTPATRQSARTVLGITDDHSDSPDFDANDPASMVAAQNLRNRVAEIILTKSIDVWISELEEAGVPCAPVNIPEEMSEDPQVVALNIMQDLTHPVTGPQKVVGPVATMSETPTVVQGHAPVLGADSAEVLIEHGIAPELVGKLIDSGVIGSA